MAVGIAALRSARRAFRVVVKARVGGIGRSEGAIRCVIVGEGHIDFPVLRIHRTPFRAVHLGGTRRISREAGIDHDVRLIGKSVGCVAGGDIVAAELELNPVAAAVGVKPGDIKLAVIEVFVTCRQAAGCIGRIP